MSRALHLVRGEAPPPEAISPQDTVVEAAPEGQWRRAGEAIDNQTLVVLLFEHDVVITW